LSQLGQALRIVTT